MILSGMSIRGKIAQFINMPDVFIRGLALTLSLLCQGIALLLLLATMSASSPQLRARPDALFLLGLSVPVSLLLFLARRDAVRSPLVAARLVLVLLIGIPLGPTVPVKVALWTSLILETCGYLSLAGCLPASFGVITVVLLFQHPFRVWGEPVQSPSVVFVVAAGAWLAGLAVLVRTLRRFAGMITEERQAKSRLDEAVRQLTMASLGFQKVASTVQERSAEDERKRITREIHDSIGYALTNLIMMMEAALRLAPEEAARLRTLLTQARDEAQLGLSETRRALHLLRAVEQVELRGLSAIQRLVTVFREATGVEVQVNYCNAALSFGAEADRAIYRMVQEGFTNAFRHGKATVIRLHFWQEMNKVRVVLWDNGTGGGNIAEGIGLSGMRERIERVGGTLQLGRVADGFELAAWIPLEGTGGHDEHLAGVG